MNKKKNDKVVKIHKSRQLNIGVIFFVIIFLYFMYYIFSYFTTKQISIYEVNQGTIAQDTVFTGLILRDESVYYAKDSGYVNYYCKDGSKASAGKYIYSVDENGNFYNQILESNGGKLALSDESYLELEKVANEYIYSYSDYDFYQIYQFKYDMEATLVEALNSKINEEIVNTISESGVSLHAYTADSAGVIAYYTDGYETTTPENFTVDMFNIHEYEKENFLKRETVKAGDAVYKVINSEIWHVIIPIEENIARDLIAEENIQVKFKKDNSTAWASSDVITKSGQNFLVLKFNNSMIRFASDRYIELELLLTDTSGLKIPNTAIVTKEFITVPKEFITKGGDSNNDGLLIEYLDKNGKKITEFRPVSIFYEEGETYYIDAEDIKLGDVAVKLSSNERYTLQDTKELEGVYNINKGYAVFKRIEKLFENEEYTIIQTGTSYGIALYDHIALDGSAVNENDIVH